MFRLAMFFPIRMNATFFFSFFFFSHHITKKMLIFSVSIHIVLTNCWHKYILHTNMNIANENFWCLNCVWITLNSRIWNRIDNFREIVSQPFESDFYRICKNVFNFWEIKLQVIYLANCWPGLVWRQWELELVLLH